MVKYIEQEYKLPHLMNYNRNINSIGSMLNYSQNPQAPLVLQPRACPAVTSTVFPY
jgi:hypothetical protein